MILCFSGTGNSRYVAEKTAKIINNEIIDINAKIKNLYTSSINTDADLVFAVPTYAWRIPKIVEQWIRDTDFCGARRAWFIMTCGDEFGNADKYNRKLCEDKKLEYMGTAQVVMPENYIAMFAVPKPATARKIILNAQPQIDEASRKIAAGQKIPAERISAIDRMKSCIINQVFYSMMVKADAFRATENCTGCGRCARLCPLNNVSIIDGRPSWGKNCTHCMACISYCPVEAIEYGRKSVGKSRYHCDQ